MDENNMLQRYINDGDAFSLHVGQYPAVAEHVNQQLIILEHTRGSSSIVDIQAARAAANSLYMTAYNEGFPDVASIFYACYEQCCRALMIYL